MCTPPPPQPQRRALGQLLLLLLVLAAAPCAWGFSIRAPSSTSSAARLALLRDLKTAAADATSSTPLSARIRTAILEGGGQQRPLTRCELELLLPRDRARLRSLEEHTGKETGKQPLSLGLSLRAYESAIVENHQDVGTTLERWRRVVALRQNRVLVPGRAAELYSQLISTLLWADEFELARQVLMYVGLTPEGVYLPATGAPLVCDLGAVCYKVGKQMLDLPLEKWEWDVEGKRRGQAEPPSPREQGEAIAEWHWKQVAPEGGDFELVHYVNDMTLSVLRMALREAKARGHGTLTLRLQEVADPAAPFWGISKRGVLLPREALELLKETDGPAVGVTLELEEP